VLYCFCWLGTEPIKPFRVTIANRQESKMKSILNIKFPVKCVFSYEKIEVSNGKQCVNTYGIKNIFTIESDRHLQEMILKVAEKVQVNPTKVKHEFLQ